MSHSPSNRKSAQVLEKQRIALLARIRRNFVLKAVSLATALLLYFYVQGERNPTVTHSFSAPVVYSKLPDGVEVELDQPQLDVRVSGPRSVMEMLKEGDLRIQADLRGIPTDRVSSQRVRLRYDVSGLLRERVQELTFDPQALPRMQIQVYPQKVDEINVTVHDPREAPAGFRYGKFTVSPIRVRMAGRLDRITRVESVVANATPSETGAEINADFPLTARDANNKPVDGVVLSPGVVHIVVPIIEEPYSKVVSISPDITDQPLPTYQISEVAASPPQVRVTGKPEDVNRISTILTRPISARDFMENHTLRVGLRLPAGITIHDLAGNPLSFITVVMVIHRSELRVPPPPVGVPAKP